MLELRVELGAVVY